ncbi:hypothetical protein [Chromobacterium haemolyticum]|uniref:hypothetical protein n=1 Tax=Chromobacterium haemolyticum TaxID=394935 RepID=UPI001375396E|nr:hypothetical protein [Chromobacterium haemolyticum]
MVSPAVAPSVGIAGAGRGGKPGGFGKRPVAALLMVVPGDELRIDQAFERASASV